MTHELSLVQSSTDEQREVLTQLKDFIRRAYPHLQIQHPTVPGFLLETEEPFPEGIAAVRCEPSSEGPLRLAVAVLPIESQRGPTNIPFALLKCLHEPKVPIVSGPLRHTKSGEESLMLWAEIQVACKPLSPTRQATLAWHLHQFETVAKQFNLIKQHSQSGPGLHRLYKPFEGVVKPVLPLSEDRRVAIREHLGWAREVFDIHTAGLAVALCAKSSAETDYALSLLGTVAPEFDTSVATLTRGGVSKRELTALTEKLPGVLAVQTSKVSLGGNPYEHFSAARAMLEQLARPVIFYGTHEQLQVLFKAGQGDTEDPLAPVVVHVPRPTLECLASFVVHQEVDKASAVMPSEIPGLINGVLSAVEKHEPSMQYVLLPVMARRMLRCTAGSSTKVSPIEFADSVASRTETLGGLRNRFQAVRSRSLQNRLTLLVEDERFEELLNGEILCQEVANHEFILRLCSEVLTRSAHQPIRMLLQGTPGGGKSETCQILATELNLPLVVIDSASMPDTQTVATQLLGQSRGIVHSEKRGRLEEAAKSPGGCVIEIADIDHAPPMVRAALGEVFLQCLERGEGQSAMGNIFSCCDLIIVFTVNLPNGGDEAVRKKVGFQNNVSRDEASRNVVSHLKEMLSSAFVSRVGQPILYEPLNGKALNEIATRAMRAALSIAAQRIGLEIDRVKIDSCVSQSIVDSNMQEIRQFGARALMERTRCSIAEAVIRCRDILEDGTCASVRIFLDGDQRLSICKLEEPRLIEHKDKGGK